MTEKDQQYIDGLKSGNSLVFEQLFKEYYPKLCNYSRRYIYDKDTVEDTVQEFFCKIWEKRDEINITTSVSSYLYKSISNHCLNVCRTHANERKVVEYQGDELQEHHLGITSESDKELQSKYGKALLELPEKRREIFELSRFEGLKYHEIAERLNISTKTVETQMGRTLEFLRKYLKEYLSAILFLINILHK